MEELTSLIATHFTEIQLITAIVLTTTAKYFMTDEGPQENETPEHKALRKRRALGGIVVGMLVSYYGHETAIRLLGLNPDDKIIMAIALAVSGEHLTRWLIGNSHKLLDGFAGIGRSKK